MVKTELITLRVTPAFKRAIEEAARAENRNVSNLIETVMAAWIAQKGRAPVIPG